MAIKIDCDCGGKGRIRFKVTAKELIIVCDDCGDAKVSRAEGTRGW